MLSCLQTQAFTPVIVDENTGVSSTLDPTIPEPMIFDLVRPLGAKKGEFEINTLGTYKLNESAGLIQWGPEIEFVIKNGFAFEFELPFQDQELEELKFAFQGTISRELEKKYIHGWQTLQKVKLHEAGWQMDYLYVYGYKFNKRWSGIGLSGVRQNLMSEHNTTSFLHNLSVFRSVSKKIKLGLESNWRIDDVQRDDMRSYVVSLVPQAHFELGKHYSLQVGAGVNKKESNYRPLFGMRLILEI